MGARLLVLWVVLIPVLGRTEVLPVRHTTPSRLLGFLTHRQWKPVSDASKGVLIPPRITIIADDRRRELRAYGDAEGIHQLRSFVAMFDLGDQKLKALAARKKIRKLAQKSR